MKYFFIKNKNKVERWFFFILINAIALAINNYAFKGLAAIENTTYSVAYPIGVTICMLLFRGFYDYVLDIVSPSKKFLASEDKKSLNPIPQKTYKKVEESDSEIIPIYPRITIRDIELDSDWKNPKHIIFDSSDFIVVNKALGTFGGSQESFSVGKEFKFKDGKLLAEKVQVDFMNVYDDYSGLWEHTDVYEGEDTPYHIQIVIWAKRTV